MKRYKQFQPLIISAFEVSEWPHPVHQHNHYELIYIRHGAGLHQIGGNELIYGQGDIFLIGPDDVHSFSISTPTKFVFIKFTDVYVHQVNAGSAFGLRQLEYLIRSRETHLSGFNLTDVDRITIAGIIQVILSLKQDELHNEQLIWLQVLTIAAILQRNMPELKAAAGRSRDMQAVFCYVHKHIYTPAKLRSKVIASQFNTTADYIGPYFKRNAGITLREYIAFYRKSLIKKRLDTGTYSLKQIAAEFGLTDESHVSKLLK
ncbi:AraC family ligand binding domain-containing protein [Mucilaginibacter sp. 21P]|uniref:AraC family transcriptional regulator n=1 Tax=Mucilaginibacter sp. 21P TaxID=2778902 RepID=UPI001C5608A1|nr:AraC family transcriptional regulator [Mucilaginibacter sp. 21P]QXV63833.1 AraC family ligand binding domain-containing protein [Mucilaginibacter sp. 21P]